MTVQREDGYFVAECDLCGDILCTEVREFYLVPETLKQHGWNVTKASGQWQHQCSKCYKESLNPQSDFEV